MEPRQSAERIMNEFGESRSRSIQRHEDFLFRKSNGMWPAPYQWVSAIIIVVLLAFFIIALKAATGL